MYHQIGLNHILSFDNFCFCLVCKKNISENVISTHLKSEEHESSCTALFKSCFPDPSCESAEIKYVNILQNLVFDVSWETGNEASYVCKSGNTLRCLICEENISNKIDDKKKLELKLVSHLKSETHCNKVKSKASWVHHPNEDTNYIAFHKFFVFCSYCKKYLKSPRNTLLQTAANHIATDLDKIFQIKLIEEQQDSAIENLCLLLDFLSISDEDQCYNNQKSQIRDVEINTGCAHFQYERKEPMEIKGLSNSQQKKVRGLKIDQFLSNKEVCEPSEAPLTSNETTKGLEIIDVQNFTNKQGILNQMVLTDLVNNNSVLKLNEQYIEIKNNRFFCKMCKVFIQFDENGISLRKHLFKDHNDLLVKRASDFILKMKNRSVKNLNESAVCDKFGLILRDISLDKKFMSHLRFIDNDGQDFICILCKNIITFTLCGKYVESHFFQPDHLKKTYEISVDTTVAKEQPDHKSKGKSKNRKPKTKVDEKAFELFFNPHGVKLQPILKKAEIKNKTMSTKPDSIKKSVLERRMLKVLRLASEEKMEVRMNMQFLTSPDEHIFCTSCQQKVIFVNSSWQVLKHCISLTHNEILIKNATDYLVCNPRPDCSKQVESDLIIQQFYELVNRVTENDPYSVTASHLLFLVISNTCTNFSTGPSWISCHLCHEPIEFTVSGVEDHFLSYRHRKQTFELNCKIWLESDSTTKSSDNQTCTFEVAETKENNLSKLELPKDTSQIPPKEDKSSEFEKALIEVLKTADQSLQEVIENNKQYVEIKNNGFSCMVCEVNIAHKRINASKLRGIILHFNGKKHRKSKELFQKAATVENKCSSHTDFLNENKTSGSKGSGDVNSSNVLPANTLYSLSKKCQEMRLNELFISFTSSNNFFCNLCQEVQIFSESGSFLKIHCLSGKHNKTLLENAIRYKVRLNNDQKSCSENDKIMLNTLLMVLKNRKPFDVITSHTQFLVVKNRTIFCLLCKQQIETSASGGKIIGHFLSYFHRVKVYALNCSSYSTPLGEPVQTLSKQPDSPKMNFVAETKSKDVEGLATACAVDGKNDKKMLSSLRPSTSQDRDIWSKELNQINDELLTLVLETLPHEFREYVNFSEVSENKLHCKLCGFKFSLKKSLPDTLTSLKDHLTEHLSYRNNFKIELNIGTRAFESFSVEVQKCIMKNIDNLEMKGGAMFCCTCKLQLCKKIKTGNHGEKFSDLNQLILHFNSKKHRKTCNSS